MIVIYAISNKITVACEEIADKIFLTICTET